MCAVSCAVATSMSTVTKFSLSNPGEHPVEHACRVRNEQHVFRAVATSASTITTSSLSNPLKHPGKYPVEHACHVFRAVATRASAAAAGRHNPELDPPEGRGVVHVKVRAKKRENGRVVSKQSASDAC
eukprot:1147815-Pelagomonas_calceolata.AAC.1